jgi:hypothetical protein
MVRGVFRKQMTSDSRMLEQLPTAKLKVQMFDLHRGNLKMRVVLLPLTLRIGDDMVHYFRGLRGNLAWVSYEVPATA